MKRILLVLLLSIVISPVFGQWQLIDEFQHWEDGQVFTQAEEIGWHQKSDLESSEYWMLSDPYSPKSSTLFVNTWGWDNRGRSICLFKELPAGGISPNSTGTVYFRILPMQIAGTTLSFGTSHLPLVTNSETGAVEQPGGMDDFNGIFQRQEHGNLRVWNESDYIAVDYPLMREQDWYSIWMVIHNDFNGDIPSGSYTVVVQGPDPLISTQVLAGIDTAVTAFKFRQPPIDEQDGPQSVIWFMWTISGYYDNFGESLFIVDDFYFSQGENLSDPRYGGGDGWAGYPIFNASGDVDTGDFLGWINVKYWPFMYQYSVGWLYIEEPAHDAPGAWTYFYK